MLRSLSLKYRIALIVFALEAIMVAFVLGSTLKEYLQITRQHAAQNEQMLVSLLSDFGRIALFTAEYGSLQSYIEEVVDSPDVDQALLINQKNIIVISNDVLDVGKPPPVFANDDDSFWWVHDIGNAAGRLGTLAIKFSHQSLMRANKSAMNRGIIVALIGMVLIALFGLLIGYLLTRRLDRLKTAAQMMADGNLSVRSGVSGNDEVAIVGEAFDHMAHSIEQYVQELKASEAQIRTAHQELEQRIRERTLELAVARDQALEASRSKSAFLANMSHELRTPLNAIIGYSEMLHEEMHDIAQESNLRDLKTIISAGSHLLGLINDILDISKIEAGKMELHFEQTDVAKLVKKSLDTVTPLAEKNGNRLHSNVGADIGLILTDPQRLQQVLINILGNACKFTEHGRISLDVYLKNRDGYSGVCFRVEDTGAGIPERNMHNLFEQFTQGDNSSTRKHGGTGLGLAISKQICQMMQGDIEVQSKLGVGSAFTVWLPTAPGKTPR